MKCEHLIQKISDMTKLAEARIRKVVGLNQRVDLTELV